MMRYGIIMSCMTVAASFSSPTGDEAIAMVTPRKNEIVSSPVRCTVI